jgi:predicted DNA-binding protein
MLNPRAYNLECYHTLPIVENIFRMIYDIYKTYTVGGKVMTTQMIIRIDPEVKVKLSKLARMEGKTTSQMVRELIEDFTKERDIGTYIDELWDRIGGKLRSKGGRQRDIDKAIKEVRKSRG